MPCKDKACNACDTVTSSISTDAALVCGWSCGGTCVCLHILHVKCCFVARRLTLMLSAWPLPPAVTPRCFCLPGCCCMGSLASGLMFAITDSILPVLSVEPDDDQMVFPVKMVPRSLPVLPPWPNLCVPPRWQSVSPVIVFCYARYFEAL